MNQMTNEQALELADQLEQAAKLLLKTVECMRATLEPSSFERMVPRYPNKQHTKIELRKNWLP